jgi:putative SOS response-associated peptidase YedK
VPPDAFDLWLDCAKVDAETAAALIAPCPDDVLTPHPVSPGVNHALNDNPQLVAPYEPPAEGPTPKPKRAAKNSDQPTLL